MSPSFVSSGDEEIDRVRKESSQTPTDESNCEERLFILYTWRRLLQRQGANTISYIPIHDKCWSAMRSEKPQELCSAIDGGFQVLEQIQTSILENPPASMPSKARKPEVSKRPRFIDWSVYGGNPQHTGYTEDLGPVKGKLSWRFPVGLAWYSRPAVENGRVYVVSPGMRTILYCLDVKTGKLIWKTRRAPIKLGDGVFSRLYATHSAASSPVVLRNVIVLNEIGAQHREQAVRQLLYIDKGNGELVKTVQAGNLDYRVGYSVVVGNEDYLIFPNGAQRIEEVPPQISCQNRIVCKETSSGETLFDFYIGPIFCEPLLDEDRVYVGTLDGVVFCLNLTNIKRVKLAHRKMAPREMVAWQFKAGEAVNSSPTVWEGNLYFGANDGAIYCLDKETGELKWKREVEPKEPCAFKFFSSPMVVEGKLCIGAANKQFYCLDAKTGKILWQYAVNDWIRSRPVPQGDKVYVAAMDGTIHCVSQREGKVQLEWKTKIGTHQIFSDLVLADGKVFVNSSDLYLWCLNAEDGKLLWRRSLLECIYRNGERIPADQVAAGGYFQSKPTVAERKVFVGTPSRFVHALDFKTGEELWRFELGAAVSGAPAYSKGRVFFGQQGGEDYFYCVNAADGNLIWKQSLSWVWSSANIYDGKIFVPSVDGYVSCLREEDGAILWRYRTGRAAHPEAPVENGKVFFGSWDHFCYALTTEKGKVVWQFYTAGTPDSGSPIAYKGRIYLPCGGNIFRCLDGDTGRIIWEYSLENSSFNASPAIHNNRIFLSVSTRGGAIPVASKIYCLEAKNGRVIWEHQGGGITAPAVADGKVYFASTSEPFFYCVDEEGNGDGMTTCLWKYKMGDRVDESVPSIYGGQAFILCSDGYLYAFE